MNEILRRMFERLSRKESTAAFTPEQKHDHELLSEIGMSLHKIDEFLHQLFKMLNSSDWDQKPDERKSLVITIKALAHLAERLNDRKLTARIMSYYKAALYK